MVAKEAKPIFFKVLSIFIIILIINLAYLVYKSGGLSEGITGFSIKENIINSYTNLPIAGQVFIITEISFLFLILLITFVRDISIIKKSNSEIIEFHIKKNEGNKTDLDALYEALKEKKEISVPIIARAFNVDNDIVLEWAKILESSNLATVEYPSFASPVIKIIEIESKPLESTKFDISKDSLKIKNEIIKSSDKKININKDLKNSSIKTKRKIDNKKIIKKKEKFK
ncbi:MAG: hypothetical protein QXW97_04230 [Candidatus Pacearchaeota archaeon]